MYFQCGGIALQLIDDFVESTLPVRRIEDFDNVIGNMQLVILGFEVRCRRNIGRQGEVAKRAVAEGDGFQVDGQSLLVGEYGLREVWYVFTVIA